MRSGPEVESGSIAGPLLAWFERHGRHDLPWQQPRTPYRVWVAEVMLQQTRVESVIPYFNRFIGHFPLIERLAAAEESAVLALWSGLGYYARARNLHRAARVVVERHGGELPLTIDQLVALPGVGRSTAAAILAQAHGLRHAILDGNVKRVLSRYHRVAGWPGNSAVASRLWQLAEHHTPTARVADYTQAIMDLGATLCHRSRPRCSDCPLARGCEAHRHQQATRYPSPRPRRERAVRELVWLLIHSPRHGLLLQQRPAGGIWGSLWTPPEPEPSAEPTAWARQRLGLDIGELARWPVIEHELTHLTLRITPVGATLLSVTTDGVMELAGTLWYKPGFEGAIGIPAPLARLLEQPPPPLQQTD